MAALVIVSITAPLVLRNCFRGGKDFQGRPGQDKTLKTLVEGSPAEVEKLLDEEKISSSLAQLQKLDLPRERRRRINRKIVLSLAAGQARSFAKLKRLVRRETARQVIDDYNYSAASFNGKLTDALDDLKATMQKNCRALQCTYLGRGSRKKNGYITARLT